MRSTGGWSATTFDVEEGLKRNQNKQTTETVSTPDGLELGWAMLIAQEMSNPHPAITPLPEKIPASPPSEQADC